MLYVFYQKRISNQPCPRVTVVAEVNGNVMTTASAKCSQKDQFVKKIGRSIAESRLSTGIITSTVIIPEGMSISAIFIYEAQRIATELTQKSKRKKRLAPVV